MINTSVRYKTIVFACLLFSISQLSMGLVFPSLPWIAKDFDIALEQAQWLVSVYLLGFGPSQFIYGPLSDVIGRKKVVLMGLTTGMFGLLIIVFHSDSFELTLIGRFFQGLGMGCCLVLANAAIRDSFKNHELGIVLSYIAITVSIVPIIAPVIGGVINHYFGWLVIFIVLLSYVSLVCVIAAFSFPETMTALKPTLDPKRVFREYWQLLTSRYFISFASLGWLNFTLLITAVSVMSFIMQNQIGMTSEEYAMWALIPASGLFIGAYASRLGQAILGRKNTLMAAYAFHMCAAIWLLNCPVEPLYLMFGLFLMVLGNGVSQPCIQAMVMRPYKKQAGVAAAALGGGEMLVASAMSIFLIHLGVDQAWHLAWVIIVFTILAFLSIIIGFMPH